MSTRETARRFHFLREIASGGFGTVYLCKVMHADGFSRLVAVKLLKSQWIDSEEVTRRIRDEARLLGLLRHRNIIDVLDLTSIGGRAAVVMEYLEAVDLRYVIKDCTQGGKRIPTRACLEMIGACANALDAAYNRPPIPGDKPLRVIHRDIKPSNIMVDESGMVKVLDFGVARSEIEGREAHTQGLQFGSVEYMAPERLFFEPETPASDVYSLGVTLYEILTLEKLGKARGRPRQHAAFVEDRLSFLRAQVPMQGQAANELEELLRESILYEHEDRPTAAGFYKRARALARALPGDDLLSWAEEELPPLIQRAMDAPRKPSPLTDSVQTEDSIAFSLARAVPETPQAPAAAQEVSPTIVFDQITEEAPKGVPDAQASVLAALRDGADPALIPASGAPRAPRMETEEILAVLNPVPAEAELPPEATQVLFEDITGTGEATLVVTDDELMPPSSLFTSPGKGSGQSTASTTRPNRSTLPPSAPPLAPDGPEPGGFPFLAVGVGLLACLGVFAVVFFADIGGLRSGLEADLADVPTAELRVPELPDLVGLPDAEVVPLNFVSAIPLRTFRVTCDGMTATGDGRVGLDLEGAASCVVQGVQEDRSRLTVTMEDVVAGTWNCFASESACVLDDGRP